jgi:hypothetical protein
MCQVSGGQVNSAWWLVVNPMCDNPQIPGIWEIYFNQFMRINEMPGILATKLHIAFVSD